jgi:hypothetical protein
LIPEDLAVSSFHTRSEQKLGDIICAPRFHFSTGMGALILFIGLLAMYVRHSMV